MADYALYKKVLEYCNHASYMTDKKTVKYDGKTGYLGIHTPGYVTVDLRKTRYVKNICFKLWDYEDPDNECPEKAERSNQVYSYRLLISENKEKWTVVHDCSDLPVEEKYRKGWQTFIWEDPVPVRYIRVHCLNGKRNSGFHIVKLHAYDQIAELDPVDTKIIIPRTKSFEKETGDAYPLSYQLNDFSGRIQEALGTRIQKNPAAKEIYDSIVDFLFRKAKEVDAVNGKVDEIRRLVAEPVKEEIQRRFEAENHDSRSNIRFSIIQIILWVIILILSIIFHG